jgi:membrane-bound serine protease (ClpP class)
MLAALALALSAATSPSSPEGRAPPRVLSLVVDDVITSGTAEYIGSAITRAQDERLDAIAIRLDTPGGHLDATRDIVQKMLASEVPIAVWVGPAGARAGSAGVFITLAANVAGMHPASNIGAAHPVTSGGGDVEKEAGKDMAKKVENDTAAFARSIARLRGRNEEWAEKAVRQSVSATADEALKLKVIDVVAPSLPAFLDAASGRIVEVDGRKVAFRGRDARLEPLEMTVRQRTLSFLGNPNVVALLMLIGTLGIALELYHPGALVPGIAGGFCLLLAFLAMRVIPVNAGAVLLLLAGVGLLVAEAFVTTHGIAGVAGAACIVIGTLLFIDRSSPEYRFDPAAFTLSPLLRRLEGDALPAAPPRARASGAGHGARRGAHRRRPRRGRGLRARRVLAGAGGGAHLSRDARARGGGRRARRHGRGRAPEGAVESQRPYWGRVTCPRSACSSLW